MDSVRFAGDDKYLKIYHLILGIIGTILVGGVIYMYLSEQLTGNWFIHLLIGVGAIVTGLSVVFGYTKPLSAIIIDDEGIRSESVLDSSFKWAKLKKVELEKNRILLQYAQTGITDIMRIPFMLRIKNLDPLSKTLSKACEENDIQFVNKLNKT